MEMPEKETAAESAGLPVAKEAAAAVARLAALRECRVRCAPVVAPLLLAELAAGPPGPVADSEAAWEQPALVLQAEPPVR